jgi:hypothetical protein
MHVWMLWRGGVNYAAPEISDAEPFASLRAAATEFARRTEYESRYYPGAYPEPSGPSAWIMFGDERPGGDVCPDRVLSFGPRGGVRIRRA